MKYLFTIIGIVLVASLLTLYFVWPEKPQPQANVAVTVNGHDFARNTITAEGAKSGYHSGDYEALLDSVITRELLIQEAQRQEIDKEVSFRDSLKTFYEQSLIKTLMDRQYNEMVVTVTDTEIDTYLSLVGRMVTFTRLPVSSTPPYAPASTEGPQNEVMFDDLSESLQILLAGLNPGETAIKFDTGSERYAIRLDKVQKVEGMEITPPERAHIIEMLEENKRQQQITRWLDDLRKKASITIHNG
jgi:hypothetical protein